MTRISAMLWNRAIRVRLSMTFNIFIGREPTPDSDGNYSEDESDFYEGDGDTDNEKQEEDEEVRSTVARPPFRTRICMFFR